MDNCRHCGADIFKHDLTKYCVKCGKELAINTCKNPLCDIAREQIILPDNASYCPVCGKATTFAEEIPF